MSSGSQIDNIIPKNPLCVDLKPFEPDTRRQKTTDTFMLPDFDSSLSIFILLTDTLPVENQHVVLLFSDSDKNLVFT